MERRPAQGMTRSMLSRFRKAAAIACGLLALSAARHSFAADPPVTPLPSFAELEATGARIGEIRVVAGNIFDTADPKENNALFRTANLLHISTHPGVIRRALLFKTGDRVSVQQIEETERLLRTNRFLYDVQFRVLAVHDGVADIEVFTRDTWSLDPGISAGRTGGANSSGIHLNEYNLLGSGMSFSFGHSKNVDRSSNEFRFANDRAFGTSLSLALAHAVNSDGRSDSVSVAQPFYALDTRRAFGFAWSRFDRIDSLYNAGDVASQYRHRQTSGEVFGGWSGGLVDHWVQRYSAGVDYEHDTYRDDPVLVAPPSLPADQTLVTPFLRYQLIEDRFERELNRNLIGRPEFFALGLAATAQVGWASTGLGSSRNALLYSGSISRGFEPRDGQTLVANVHVAGQYGNAQVQHQQFGAQAQYYVPQGPRSLFFASAAGDTLTHADDSEALLLGGDNGLRGYPLRYQSGTRRAQFTVEERGYTDLYVWRLFRVGGAAFYDLGRAWGGNNTNAGNPGWLSNAGFGLRIVSARAAFSNVLHVDLAFPLNATPDIRKLQFLVKTKASF